MSAEPPTDAPLPAAVPPALAPSALIAAALAQLSEGVIVADANGCIQFVNEAAARLHGVSKVDVCIDEYSTTYRLFTEDGEPYPSAELPLARAVLRGETVIDERWRIRRPDGTDVLAVGSARPVLGPGGDRLGAVLTLRDDAERAAAERAHAAEHRAAQILERVSDAHVALDRDLRYVAVNAAGERSMRRTRDELLGRTLLEVFPSAAGSESERHYKEVVREGVEAHWSEHFVGDGLDNHVEVDAYPTEDGGVAVFWREVTARVRAEAALRESEARYRTLFESIDVGFCVVEMHFDEHGRPWDYRFIEANPAFERQAGLVDAIGRTARELVPGLEAHWFEIYGDVATTGRSTRFQQASEPMGRWFDVYALRIGRPEERRVAILFTDISAKKAAERERDELLRAIDLERSRLATVFARSPSMLALVRGPRHVFELANEAYLRLIGGRDVIGKPLLEAVPELRGQGFDVLLDEVLATGEPFVGREVPTAVSPAAGAPPEERFFDFFYLPVTEADGTRSGVIAHGNDVTDLVRARRDAERLLALSETARAEAEVARERSMRLHALTAALSMSSTPEQVAEAVVAHAPAVLDAAGVVIARTMPDGASLEIMHAGDMPDDLRDAWRRFPLNAPVPLAEVARTGEPLFFGSRAESTARYPAMAPLLEAAGHHANAIAPLVIQERVLGTLGAAFRAERDFTEVERALVLTVAQQCAQALERARLFEAERAARAEAEAANRAKSDFLAVMSHELRTPLNAIGGYAELMEMGIRGPVTAQQAEDLRRIQASQRHLLGLVNEVLNYARIETGSVHYDLVDVPLMGVIASVEPLVAPQLAAKRLTYTVRACDPPPVACADREKVRQVLLNLLSNAVKFTDAGGRVEVSCINADDRVMIRVHDTGIGIAEHELGRIFEPFVQVNASLTRTQEGTGLGLAISRDLARGMDGDLTAESEWGVGSTFTLTLPKA